MFAKGHGNSLGKSGLRKGMTIYLNMGSQKGATP
jgi:hypothetical protein